MKKNTTQRPLLFAACTIAMAAAMNTAFAGPNDFGEARGSYVPIPDVSDKRQMTFLWNSHSVKWNEYFAEWRGMQNVLVPSKRTSNVANCAAGELNPAYREQIVRQINAFRAVAGLDSAAVANKAANDAAQAAALIQQQYWATTKQQTHFPQPTDRCYSASGAVASARSNVGIGYAAGPAVAPSYIDDVGGGGNEFVGHRLSMLYVGAHSFAVGDVMGPIPGLQSPYSGFATTLIAGVPNSANPSVVFWPPQNAMLPVEWFPISSNRFSVQCTSCDFSGTTVSMTFQGRALNVVSRFSGGVFVFEPQGVSYGTGTFTLTDADIRKPETDEVFTIDVRNVMTSAGRKDYQYTVTVFDAYKELATRVYPAYWVGGLWNNDDNGEAGWGVNFAHGTTGTLFGTVYTYTESGQPRWLAMPGCTWTTPTQCVGAVYSTTGSSFALPFDAAKYRVVPEGTLTVNFSTAKTGSLVWTRADGTQIAARPLKRFENMPEVYRDGTSYAGLWNGDLNAGAAYETGWGVSIDQYFSTIVAVWYIYDDNNAPMWVILPGGNWTSTTTYEGQLYRATGTSLAKPWVADDYRPTAVGNARLVFETQDSATFTYSIEGRSVTKQVKRFGRY